MASFMWIIGYPIFDKNIWLFEYLTPTFGTFYSIRPDSDFWLFEFIRIRLLSIRFIINIYSGRQKPESQEDHLHLICARQQGAFWFGHSWFPTHSVSGGPHSTQSPVDFPQSVALLPPSGLNAKALLHSACRRCVFLWLWGHKVF